MTLSHRIQGLDASGIRRMFDLAAKLQDPVNLSIGQPHYDIPESIKEGAIAAIREGRNTYTPTQGVQSLREAILDKYARRGIPQEDGFITSGVSGGALLALIAMCDPGDEIILPDPYFVFYKGLAQVFGMKPVLLDTYPDFRWREDKLVSLLSPRTRAIILASPANPTGVSCTENELKMIASVAAQNNLWVLYDEIYDQFSYDSPHLDMARYYPKTLTLGGFSKSHSMTGWRVGTAVGPKEIIQAMCKLQQYSYVCAPSVGQFGALTAIHSAMDNAVEDYRNKRNYLLEQLTPYYDIVKPDGAFYMFVRAPHGLSGEEFAFKALDYNLIVVPGKVFSEKDTHFRLSFAASDETLEKGVALLVRMARELGHSPSIASSTERTTP